MRFSSIRWMSLIGCMKGKPFTLFIQGPLDNFRNGISRMTTRRARQLAYNVKHGKESRGRATLTDRSCQKRLICSPMLARSGPGDTRTPYDTVDTRSRIDGVYYRRIMQCVCRRVGRSAAHNVEHLPARFCLGLTISPFIFRQYTLEIVGVFKFKPNFNARCLAIILLITESWSALLRLDAVAPETASCVHIHLPKTHLRQAHCQTVCRTTV